MALPLVLGVVLLPAVAKLATEAYESFSKASEDKSVSSVDPVILIPTMGSIVGKIAVIEYIRNHFIVSDESLSKLSGLLSRFQDRIKKLTKQNEVTFQGRTEKTKEDHCCLRFSVITKDETYFMLLAYTNGKEKPEFVYNDSEVYDVLQQMKHNPTRAKFVEIL